MTVAAHEHRPVLPEFSESRLIEELKHARQSGGTNGANIQRLRLLTLLATVRFAQISSAETAIRELLREVAPSAKLPPGSGAMNCEPLFPDGINALWGLTTETKQSLAKRKAAAAVALGVSENTFEQRTCRALTHGLAIELMKLAAASGLVPDQAITAAPPEPTIEGGLLSAERHGRHIFKEFAAEAKLTVSAQITASLLDPVAGLITKAKRQKLQFAVQPLFHPFGYGELRNFEDRDGVLGAHIYEMADDVRVSAFDYWRWFPDGTHYGLSSVREDEHEPERALLDWEMRALRSAESLLYVVRMYEGLGIEPAARLKVTLRYSGLQGWKMGGHHVFGNRFSLADEAESELVGTLSELRQDFHHQAGLLLAPIFRVFRSFEPPPSRLSDRIDDVLNGRFS